MRIGIQTWGTHGDIRPFIALADGLCASGHDVTLYATLVEGNMNVDEYVKKGIHIEFIDSPVIDSREKFVTVNQAIVDETNQIMQGKKIFEYFFTPKEDSAFIAATRLCQTNDIVIGHYLHYPLMFAARKYNIPFVSVILVTSIIPSAYRTFTGHPNLGRIGNSLMWFVVRKLANKQISPLIHNFAYKHKLPPIKDVYSDLWCSGQLSMVAVSPALCKRYKDWSDTHHICGFFNMPNMKHEGTLPEDVSEFLSKGEPPVYMTFGSWMPESLSEQRNSIELFRKAATLTGCRAIIQASLWKECGFERNDEFYFVRKAPHGLIFPKCAALVHHGGAGTTQAACLAGIPSIVIYHIYEQNFWAAELKRSGLAPDALPRRDLTPNNLSKRLRSLLDSPLFRKQAQKIQASMQKENGVAEAINLLVQGYPQMQTATHKR